VFAKFAKYILNGVPHRGGPVLGGRATHFEIGSLGVNFLPNKLPRVRTRDNKRLPKIDVLHADRDSELLAPSEPPVLAVTSLRAAELHMVMKVPVHDTRNDLAVWGGPGEVERDELLDLDIVGLGNRDKRLALSLRHHMILGNLILGWSIALQGIRLLYSTYGRFLDCHCYAPNDVL